jgi:pimeloyl-ACP methyl ester carboxylesterase
VQELLGRALESASLVPFQIASVTLLNGGVLVDRTRPLLAQKFLDSVPGRALAPRMPGPIARRLFERGLRHIAGPDRPPPVEELANQYALIEHGGGRRLLPYLAGYMTERKIHRKRWRRALLTHPYPMRLVWGDSDPINPWPVVEEIVRARPQTQAIRLHRVGHYPQLEAPGQVAVHLLEFTAG